MAGHIYAYAPIGTPSHAHAALWSVLVLLCLPVLIVLARVVAQWLSQPRLVQGVCGRCGYSTRGLPGTTCPECGADLAVVGTHRLVSRARGRGALLACAAWAILLFSINAAYWHDIDMYLLRLLHGVDYYSATMMNISPPPPTRDARLAAIWTGFGGGVAVISLVWRRRPRGTPPP